jgi:hypothetical protein
MSQLKYSQRAIALIPGKVFTRLQLPNIVKIPKPIDVICILLPLCAIILWSISLRAVDLRHMTGLGLVSVFPPSMIIALIVLTISFCLTLGQTRVRVPVLLLHLVLLVFMLYGITLLVEEAPRFSTVYQNAGYIEYIMRTGSVDPTLDFYFNYPGFFVLNAFVTRAAGYHDVLSYAEWAPVFFNLIYLGPIYMIFTSATNDKRLVWLGLWFFALTNWIWQDSFVPQGLNFFLYLVIIAILLKWFKVPPAAQPRKRRQHSQHLGRFSLLAHRLYMWLTAPDTLRTPSQPRQRIALLVILVVIFALVVFSHPLTPFFVLASVTALVIFRRCTPRWLPILMAAMTGAWIIFMTQPFLAGHSFMVTGDIGQVTSAVTSNVTNHVVQGTPEHIFIADMRVIMTALIWGLALVGGVRRLLRGYGDVTFVLLAVAPFPLLLVQSYGGEMLLRIYLFTLPLMAFFAAALFYTTSTKRSSLWLTAVIAGTSIVLLGGFLFTRYGNELKDYMTRAEVDGVRYLYSIAPPHSLLIEGWDGTPWQFQDYEKYTTLSLVSTVPDAVRNKDVNRIVQLIESEEGPAVYMIFTRSQEATAESFDGLPPGTEKRLEDALLTSGKFKLIYSNPDVQIFEYLH